MKIRALLQAVVTDYSPVAQLVERVTVNHQVGGSSPSRGAIFLINRK